jgi:hypothetical protein
MDQLGAFGLQEVIHFANEREKLERQAALDRGEVVDDGVEDSEMQTGQHEDEDQNETDLGGFDNGDGDFNYDGQMNFDDAEDVHASPNAPQAPGQPIVPRVTRHHSLPLRCTALPRRPFHTWLNQFELDLLHQLGHAFSQCDPVGWENLWDQRISEITSSPEWPFMGSGQVDTQDVQPATFSAPQRSSLYAVFLYCGP